MDNVFSGIIEVLKSERTGGVRLFLGEVTGEEAPEIKVSGEPVSFFRKNSELTLKDGDMVLCLFDDEDIYVICKVG